MKSLHRTRLTRLVLIGIIAVTLIILDYFLKPAALRTYPRLAIASCEGETISIDSIQNSVVLDREPNPPIAHVSSFLISWKDNIPSDDELGIGIRNIYWRRRMPDDWTALAHGDSVHVVYFRERPLLNRHLHQGALVFPTPPGCCVDTLVYTGDTGPWHQQLFVLRRE
jgi:hypothetical protein